MSLDVTLTETRTETRTIALFEANITHNLNRMAEAAGIYKHLWRPEEIGITKASELIEPLTKALEDMKANREKYEVFEPENKWGTYENFIPWIEKYLNACIENPNAEIHVNR